MLRTESIEICGFLGKAYNIFLVLVEINVYTIDLGSLIGDNNLFVRESSFTHYFLLLIKKSHLFLLVLLDLPINVLDYR